MLLFCMLQKRIRSITAHFEVFHYVALASLSFRSSHGSHVYIIDGKVLKIHSSGGLSWRDVYTMFHSNTSGG
jgi:hypothetical protein